MMGFWGNIADFWSSELAQYKFTNVTPVAPRNDYHANFQAADIQLYQSFNEQLPNIYTEFYRALTVEDGSVCWLCLEPNQMIPVHRDYFYVLKTKKNVDVSKCIRYLVLLEDWQLGHMVQLGNKDLTGWKKGDVWYFDSTVPHCAANAGTANFYSCQVSTLK